MPLFSANLLRGKPVTPSSILLLSHGPALAVDGNRDPYWAHGHCTATQLQAYPWMLVDMGKQYQITRVTVSNTDGSRKLLIQSADKTLTLCDVYLDIIVSSLKDKKDDLLLKLHFNEKHINKHAAMGWHSTGLVLTFMVSFEKMLNTCLFTTNS